MKGGDAHFLGESGDTADDFTGGGGLEFADIGGENVNEAAAAVQAQYEFALERGAEAEDHFIAVIVNGLGGDHVADEFLGVGNAVEGFDENFLLEAELGGIGGVAEGAPAAIARPRTVRIDAVGGGLEHLDGAAKGKFLFLLIDACTHRFVG